MSKLAVSLAVLAALVAGCAASNSASQNTSPEETTTTETKAQSTQLANIAEKTAPAPEETAAARGEPSAHWVSAIGDSVMVGAIEALEQEIPSLSLLNAQGSRQPTAATDLLQRWRAAGYLGDAVVIHIGNNGPFTAEHQATLTALAKYLSARGHVVEEGKHIDAYCRLRSGPAVFEIKSVTLEN